MQIECVSMGMQGVNTKEGVLGGKGACGRKEWDGGA